MSTDPPAKVLVVEDTEDTADFVKLLLSAEGYDVHVAYNGEDGLRAVRDFAPDVMLVDIQLPGIDGLELTRRVRADPATADAAIIVFTAFVQEEDRRRAFDAGCDGFIPKPFPVQTLRDEIQRLLDARRSR